MNDTREKRKTIKLFGLAGWKHLCEMSVSVSRELRQIALIRGYAWVEHALEAADVPGPPRPIAARILRMFNNPLFNIGLNPEVVRYAIDARHKATHQDTVPDPKICEEAISTFENLWHALGRSFVKMEKAIELAHEIQKDASVLCVCMYGSMARGDHDPNDIDLLILDDGTYTVDLPGQYIDGDINIVEGTWKALKNFNLRKRKLMQAAKCRWLDIIMINGSRFGYDEIYTKAIQSCQSDPWFFVNISKDLLEYDPNGRSFKEASIYPFDDIRGIVKQLSKYGIFD